MPSDLYLRAMWCKHAVLGTERVIARKICGGSIGDPKHRKVVIVLVIMCSQCVFARDAIWKHSFLLRVTFIETKHKMIVYRDYI